MFETDKEFKNRLKEYKKWQDNLVKYEENENAAREVRLVEQETTK